MPNKLVAEWKPEWKTRLDKAQSLLSAERADSLVKARKRCHGASLGATIPSPGRPFCDGALRQELVAFLSPLAPKYDGLHRNLDQTLETIRPVDRLSPGTERQY